MKVLLAISLASSCMALLPPLGSDPLNPSCYLPPCYVSSNPNCNYPSNGPAGTGILEPTCGCTINQLTAQPSLWNIVGQTTLQTGIGQNRFLCGPHCSSNVYGGFGLSDIDDVGRSTFSTTDTVPTTVSALNGWSCDTNTHLWSGPGLTGCDRDHKNSKKGLLGLLGLLALIPLLLCCLLLPLCCLPLLRKKKKQPYLCAVPTAVATAIPAPMPMPMPTATPMMGATPCFGATPMAGTMCQPCIPPTAGGCMPGPGVFM